MQLEVGIPLHGDHYKTIQRQLKQRLGEVYHIQTLLVPFIYVVHIALWGSLCHILTRVSLVRI